MLMIPSNEKMQFSVSICVYGGDDASNFRAAMESIYNQTLPPDEVVLTVDGPVPISINNIILYFQEKYNTKIVRLPRNVGHGQARNAGLEQCKHEYVAIADADDINRKDRFEKQMLCFYNNPDLSVVSSWSVFFESNIENICFRQNPPINDQEIKKAFRYRCSINQAAAMFKKSIIESVGGYIDWFYAEDYYLWVRLILGGAKFHNIPEYLVYVRTGFSQTMRRGGLKYFISNARLFLFMFKEKFISVPLFIYNVSTRFIIQVLLPSGIRAMIRKKALKWRYCKVAY